MKLFAKSTVVLLLAALLSVGSLVSCVKKENDAPDGMMIVSAAGADYLLYAPTTWNRNTVYGVSGAYRDVSEQSTVSVSRFSAEGFTAEEGADRNAAYWETVCLPLIRAVALNGEVTDRTGDDSAALFGGADAVRRHVSAIVNGKTLHFVRIIAERNGYFYVFAFTVTDALYDYCIADANKMAKEFVFTDTPYVPEDYAWKPAKVAAPDGMQVASSDEVSYRFFVPADWVVDRDRRIFSAYEPTDRTNISVVPFLPDTGTSVDDYFAASADLMRETAGEDGFTLLSDAGGVETELGGRPAKQYDFLFTVGGERYRYRQIIALYKGMLYTVTYTAAEARFEEHLDALDAVRQAFAFR